MVTPEGDSEAIDASMTVQTGGETKRFDIKLAKGQVLLPLTDPNYRVDIELAKMRDAKSSPRPTFG
jgi:hypothetical protein